MEFHSTMTKYKECISFEHLISDRTVVPMFNVSLFDEYDNKFIQNWKNFLMILSQMYTYTYKENISKFVKFLKLHWRVVIDDSIVLLPKKFDGGVLYNFPDLYDADSKQIMNFVDKTELRLDQIRIRTNPNSIICNLKLHPYNFLNLDVHNYNWLIEKAKQQEKLYIWMSIVTWLKYRDDNVINYNIIDVIEEHCMPKILYCNYFIMVYARSLILFDYKLKYYLDSKINDVVWDSDFMSDCPSFHISTCKDHIKHPMFLHECKRLGML